MTYNQIVAFFGGLSKAAQAIGSSRQNVHSWGARKRIPTPWQIKIEGITGLPADSKAKKEAQDFAPYFARRNGGARQEQ